MHFRRYRTSRFMAAMGLLLALLIAPAAVAAERHEVREGDLVLRSNLMTYGDLDPATAERHGIQPGKARAVLNVALARASDGRNVPATVSASTRDSRGERQKILLRQVDRGAEISYIGSFESKPGQELEFVVEAQPAGGKHKRLLTLAFRERMPPE